MPIKLVGDHWEYVPSGTKDAHKVTQLDYGTPASPAHPSNWPKGKGGRERFWPKGHRLGIVIQPKKKP